jgi:replication initiation and membrane attachment protein DnaB
METGNAEIIQHSHRSMRATGIKTKKDYRRALRDLEALGFVKSVKFGRAMLAEDEIIIEVPPLDTHTQGLN